MPTPHPLDAMQAHEIFDGRDNLLEGAPYTLEDGTNIVVLQKMIGYLRALSDLGVPYGHFTGYKNVLAFWVGKPLSDAPESAHYVVQFPLWDDATNDGTPENPHVGYGLATFIGAWPELNCIVTGGGTLGIWPHAVRSERNYEELSYSVNLISGRAVLLPGIPPRHYDTEVYEILSWCDRCHEPNGRCICIFD